MLTKANGKTDGVLERSYRLANGQLYTVEITPVLDVERHSERRLAGWTVLQIKRGRIAWQRPIGDDSEVL
jgi:hypothetical protein